MSKKPGVMLYFELLEPLKRMSLEEAGKMVIAILEYGQTQTVPELPDSLYVFWPMIQQRLDVDDERYEKKVAQASYAADARWAKERNEEVPVYKDWLDDYKKTGKADAFYRS